MRITLTGTGCGEHTYTKETTQAIADADLLIGAGRVLASLPEGNAKRIAEYLPEQIAEIVSQTDAERVCIVLSGDSGFYSGAAGTLRALNEADVQADICCLPGISSVSYFAAKLGRAWQDWHLVSAHGTDCDVLSEIMCGKPVCFLTGSAEAPGTICKALTETGLGDLRVSVGENLGMPKERIVTGSAEELSLEVFAPLQVVLCEAAPVYVKRVPGIPDETFQRGNVPMTKREVRTAILAALGIRKDDLCWDIGAGTGSVAVEMALKARAVHAVEEKKEAVSLIETNKKSFCAWNLCVVAGTAPEALSDLPVPDAVFIGGSGGSLREIVRAAYGRNRYVRICISAITLETLQDAVAALSECGYEPDVTQIAVSRAETAGAYHLMKAQNPVFLITGTHA